MIAGTLSGFLVYDLLHYYYHFGGEPPFDFLKRLKVNHLKHHYKDYSKGFGVSTTIWDTFFKSNW